MERPRSSTSSQVVSAWLSTNLSQSLTGGAGRKVALGGGFCVFVTLRAVILYKNKQKYRRPHHAASVKPCLLGGSAPFGATLLLPETFLLCRIFLPPKLATGSWRLFCFRCHAAALSCCRQAGLAILDVPWPAVFCRNPFAGAVFFLMRRLGSCSCFPLKFSFVGCPQLRRCFVFVIDYKLSLTNFLSNSLFVASDFFC